MGRKKQNAERKLLERSARLFAMDAERDYKRALLAFRAQDEPASIVAMHADNAFLACMRAWCRVQDAELPESDIELLYWRAYRLKRKAHDRAEEIG